MTLKRWIIRAATVPATALVFSATWAVARPSPEVQVQHALRLVHDDRSSLVCADRTPCAVRDARYTLFVFFSLRDCPIALYETVVFDSLYRSVPVDRLAIVGVGYDLSRDEARALATSSGITYPLFMDAARLERYLANPRPAVGNKPVAVLVSRSGAILSRTLARTTVEWLHEDAAGIRARIMR